MFGRSFASCKVRTTREGFQGSGSLGFAVTCATACVATFAIAKNIKIVVFHFRVKCRLCLALKI